MTEEPVRCGWANSSPLMMAYHDEEWGVPIHDDRHLFELLVLEGAQAGLSWSTILNRREGYRELFLGFDPTTVASWDAVRIEELLSSPKIVRNRAKVRSAIDNARAFLEVASEFGSFDTYLWEFVDGHPRRNAWRTLSEVPAETTESQAMSKDLRRRGFRFVGPTICYAYMQSAGLIDDHLLDCFRYTTV